MSDTDIDTHYNITHIWCADLNICKLTTLCQLQGLVFLTIILLAMLGNLLVIVSVLRTKTLRRQKAYYFVVSLALAGDMRTFSLFLLNNL